MKKINIILLILVLVIFGTAAFFGYKFNTKANTDAVCSYIHTTKETQKEQVKTSCSNINWSEWKTVGKNSKKRTGIGSLNIIDYSKLVVVGKETKTRRGFVGFTGCTGIGNTESNLGSRYVAGLSKSVSDGMQILKTPFVCSAEESMIFDPNSTKNGNGNNQGGIDKNGGKITRTVTQGKQLADSTVINTKDIPQNISQGITCSINKKKWFDCESQVIKLLDINTLFYIKTIPSVSCTADTSAPTLSNSGDEHNFVYGKTENPKQLEYVTTVKAETKNAGKVINQKVQSSYCLDRVKDSKNIKVKILNLKVKEI